MIDPLQRRLQFLVAQLKKAPDLFRQLCRLAREHGLKPEDFRSRLVRAGLAQSRASELMTVLESETHCAAFLKPPGEPGRQSWQETLAAARRERVQREAGLAPDQQRAARVAGKLHRGTLTYLLLNGGLLVLEPRAVDLEAWP